MDVIKKSALEQQVDRVRAQLNRFLRAQTLSGAVLLVALAAALLMVNGGWGERFRQIQEAAVAVQLGPWQLSGNLLGWVNDGLIAIFFFLVGLEIKREFLAGELQGQQRRRLVIVAAIGGMLLPATIYAGVNLFSPQGVSKGWGIPMATDTALSIGLLAALRGRIPRVLTALLVGLAIVDDIGAILVVAFFYTESLIWSGLGIAAVTFVLLLGANYAGLRHPLIYLGGAVVLWLSIHHGGIHSSVAGAVAAVTVPARPRLEMGRFAQSLLRLYRHVRRRVGHSDVLADQEEHEELREIEAQALRATTPLRRWEDSLGLPVALVVLPAFVFLNGGIRIDEEAFAALWGDPVAIGVILGLVLGKPLGILAAAYLASRTGFAPLPTEMGWKHLLGLGMVAGIGFTMSTFIAGLALSDAELATAKLAILTGSMIAATGGLLVLLRTGDHQPDG